MDQTLEQWRSVVGHEDCYEVSSQGKLRSVDRVTPHGRFRKGKLLKITTDRQGRPRVSLYKNGILHNYKVHSLVLAAFVGPRPHGMNCLHGPGGCADNRLENLYYGTQSQNMGEDRLRDGTDSRGEKHGSNKLTAEQVICIRESAESHSSLASYFKVSPSTISDIKSRRKWAWLN